MSKVEPEVKLNLADVASMRGRELSRADRHPEAVKD